MALRHVRAELADLGCPVSVQLFSSLKRQGVAEAATVLKRWLGLCDNEAPPPIEGCDNSKLVTGEEDA